MTIEVSQLTDYLDDLLKARQIRDFCPNGLQVSGKGTIKRIMTGVTASQALVDQAVAANVDALLVHHGYFWKNESPAIVGMKKRRIKALLDADINLIAYHLPLDAHPELGNNAQLAKLMNWTIDGTADPNDPGSVLMLGRVEQPCSSDALADALAERLNRSLTCYVPCQQPINRIAWCTGGGQGFIDQAAALGVDGFITGEVSEQTVHSAREQGIAFFAAGHHATERYGAKALGEHLAHQFNLDVDFVDIDNPA
ncbi:dinuclear metal center YbgI/SA1388 family protein [Idiomarina fontislapidosi]|uniref:GTP cyclohydrolase 1 type 2 homolog n=1 Tax=Idiomarina fontislapidosi TaxID=263723 RepID=A0A432Y9G6_9GAMM|nr:Nif3-like dinuclear metal center hexameric protein [Idiomarina fontislapidosi]PYE34433.1 dinuclear metal center YbgI/SA1388 family protein [Idiomarina fontislapidosi]RUO57608.1 Nif3-like dinuclear metal center hexameric protein [Idiomarina fontislapidosi]